MLGTYVVAAHPQAHQLSSLASSCRLLKRHCFVFALGFGTYGSSQQYLA